MPNDLEAELKSVEGASKEHPEELKHDPNLTGGERAETPGEKQRRPRRKDNEPPIIQKDVS